MKFGNKKKGSREIIVESFDGSFQQVYNVSYGKHILVQEGDEIPAGEKITDGPIDPHDILKIKGTNAVQEYLVNEVQEVYRLQGVKINDKHIEVIVKQMLQKLRVMSSGDSSFIEEDLIHRGKFIQENEKLKSMVVVEEIGDSELLVGDLLTKPELRELNNSLSKKDKVKVKAVTSEPATFGNVLLGITQAALSTESFISAASFQETTKVLTNASIAAKTDHLVGLKENVVMGHLIPAGTGLKKYKEVILTPPEVVEPEVTSEVEEKNEA